MKQPLRCQGVESNGEDYQDYWAEVRDEKERAEAEEYLRDLRAYMHERGRP